MITAVFFLFFVIYTGFGSVYTDPDFGWRLQTGRIIGQSGIPATDPFSYTMSSYPFVDHEWLTHYASAAIYDHFGIAALASIYALLAVLSVMIVLYPLKREWWRLIFALLALTTLLHYFAPKPLVISWLFSAVLVRILLDRKMADKFGGMIPFLFLLWANLHGGFIFGLGILVLYTSTGFFSPRTNRFKYVILTVFSALATLINPYGVHLTTEVLKSVFDARLRLYVLEWIPAFIHMNLMGFFAFSFSFLLLFKTWKHIGLFERAVFITGTIAAFSSARNIPLWLMATLPITLRNADIFTHSIVQVRDGARRYNLLMKCIYLLVVCGVIFELVFVAKSTVENRRKITHLQHAVEYVKTNPSEGNIFTTYEWGGYFIWRYPEKKVFIDGRMPSWKQTPPAASAETRDALDLHIKFLSLKTPMRQTLERYDIDTLVIPNTLIETDGVRIGKDATKQAKAFRRTIQQNGFKAVYTNDTSTVFRRPL